MNLLQPLVAGVRGAENGSAAIMTRSGGRATYYTNFDGSGAVTPTGDVTLDANGGLVAYVNQLVDVTVKSSSGTTVRSFTQGVSAPDVEVISDSFTGIDYTTGQSASSKPSTLQAVLDKWDDSAGADDFKVLLSGVATNLSAAFASAVAAAFYNVKSSTYGALGNGTTDDTSAIQAALTAANAAGGGIVFFPAGSYRTTAVLTVPDKVSLLGSGSLASYLLLDSGAADTIQKTSGTSPWYVSGLGFEFNVANTAGTCIKQTVASQLVVLGCSFGLLSNNFQFKGIDLSAGILSVVGCNFVLNGTAANCRAVSLSAAGVAAAVVATRVAVGIVAYVGQMMSFAGGGLVLGCTFDFSSQAAGGTGTGVIWSATTMGAASVGNVFRNAGAGTATDYQLPADTTSLAEAGNTYGTTVLHYTPVVTAQALSHEGYGSQARDKRRYYIASDASPITLPAASYGYAEVARSNNAAQTLNLDTPPGPGQSFVLTLNNNQAGVSGSITMGANVKGLAPFTVNANTFSTYQFRSVEIGVPATARYWALVGSVTNQAP
jgi:hypothetical protein